MSAADCNRDPGDEHAPPPLSGLPIFPVQRAPLGDLLARQSLCTAVPDVGPWLEWRVSPASRLLALSAVFADGARRPLLVLDAQQWAQFTDTCMGADAEAWPPTLGEPVKPLLPIDEEDLGEAMARAESFEEAAGRG